MRIFRWNKRGKMGNDRGTFIRITEREAWALVRSFANQVLEKTPNVGRLEQFTDDGEYVSVSVLSPEQYANVAHTEDVAKRINKRRKS